MNRLIEDFQNKQNVATGPL